MFIWTNYDNILYLLYVYLAIYFKPTGLFFQKVHVCVCMCVCMCVSQPGAERIITVSHWILFVSMSEIKDRSKDKGSCTSHCLYLLPTVFVYLIKTVHLVARRNYMVLTQG